MTRMVRRVRRLASRLGARTPGERRMLVRVGLRLVATRVALAVLPYRTVAAHYARPVREVGARAEHRRSGLWAVRVVGPRVLGARPCLAQALVAERVLRQAGAAPTVRIGVAQDADGPLRAHAWVECDGDIVVGGRGSYGLYTAMRPVGN